MNDFGEMLRCFRKTKNYSQFDLSSEVGVSAKHISFLETGRSKPSRQIVLSLSQVLGLNLRQQNLLLNSAGYAEGYTRNKINDDKMGSISDTLRLMIDNHNPYPAIVIDWDWNIILSNSAYQNLIRLLTAMQPGFSTSTNIVELIFDPKGFKPVIKNWQQISCLALLRLHHEQLENKGRHAALLERLKASYEFPENWNNIDYSEHPDPVICIEIELNGYHLKLLTTLSSFGTPIDITVEEIMIEHYFPADEVTKTFFEYDIAELNANLSSAAQENRVPLKKQDQLRV